MSETTTTATATKTTTQQQHNTTTQQQHNSSTWPRFSPCLKPTTTGVYLKRAPFCESPVEMDPSWQPVSGAAQRRRGRRLRAAWRHEQQSIAQALAAYTHHSAPRRQTMARAGGWERAVLHGQVPEHPTSQAAGVQYFAMDAREDVGEAPAAGRPAPLLAGVGGFRTFHQMKKVRHYLRAPDRHCLRTRAHGRRQLMTCPWCPSQCWRWSLRRSTLSPGWTNSADGCPGRRSTLGGGSCTTPLMAWSGGTSPGGAGLVSWLLRWSSM